MSRSHRVPVFLVFLALIFSCTLVSIPCPFLRAQEVPYKLDEIIVTATRIEEPLKDAPANVTVITSEDIRKKGATTITEIFKDEPGVFVQNQTGGPKFTVIDIRGYGEAAPQNVLVLVDGRRVNNIDISGADLAQIPLDMVERVEIYRGPATVMFGDNAMGGVINIIMKKGEGKPLLKAEATVGSYNLFNPVVYASGRQGKFSYFALASSYDTDGYRQNNALQMKDLFGNFSFDPHESLTLTVKAGYHKDRYGMPGPLLWSSLSSGLVDPQDSLEPFNWGHTEDSFIDGEVSFKPVDGLSFLIGGFYRHRNTGSWFTGSYAGTSWYTESRGKLETYSLTPKVVVDKPIFGLKSTLVAGFDYYRNPTNTDWDGRFFGFLSDTTAKIEKTDYGFYVNEKLHPLDALLLDVGYRIHKAGYDTDFTDRVYHKASSYRTDYTKNAFRANANYSFSETGALFLTYANGFRFPATDELVNVQTGKVNTTLKPQTGWELDAGLRWNPFSKVGGAMTFFYIKNQDEIYFNPMTYENANYDRTERQGVEALVNLVPLEDLRLDLSYSYLRARLDDGLYNGNDIPFVPSSKFSAKANYTWQDFGVNALLVYTGPRYAISDLANTRRMLPGYTTLDFNVTYRYKKLQAQVGVKNLTGTAYNEYGVASADPRSSRVNLYPSPDRQYFFRMSYTFGG